MDNIINQDGPDQYSIPKIDAAEADPGTYGTWPADATSYSIRAGVGRVKANKFGGKCIKCNAWIKPLEGLLILKDKKYGVSHRSGACSA